MWQVEHPTVEFHDTNLRIFLERLHDGSGMGDLVHARRERFIDNRNLTRMNRRFSSKAESIFYFDPFFCRS